MVAVMRSRKNLISISGCKFVVFVSLACAENNGSWFSLRSRSSDSDLLTRSLYTIIKRAYTLRLQFLMTAVFFFLAENYYPVFLDFSVRDPKVSLLETLALEEDGCQLATMHICRTSSCIRSEMKVDCCVILVNLTRHLV